MKNSTIPKVQKLASEIDEEKLNLEKAKLKLEQRRLFWQIACFILAIFALYNVAVLPATADFLDYVANKIVEYNCKYIKKHCSEPDKEKGGKRSKGDGNITQNPKSDNSNVSNSPKTIKTPSKTVQGKIYNISDEHHPSSGQSNSNPPNSHEENHQNHSQKKNSSIYQTDKNPSDVNDKLRNADSAV